MKTNIFNISLFLLVLTPFCLEAQQNSSTSWDQKIDEAILHDKLGKTSNETKAGTFPFLVYLSSPDLSVKADQFKTKEAKSTFMYEQLRMEATKSQAALIQALKQEGVSFQSFWIANAVEIQGDLTLAKRIASMPEVMRITTNPEIRTNSQGFSAPQTLSPLLTTEWGLTKIKADQVWALGYKGQNVVVAGQDTGYQWDHPAIKAKYRGWDGTNSSHAYNWHDSIHAIDPNNIGSNPCGLDLKYPCDDHGHGTHTMGTMVGLDGTNGIGVAPDAKWIACRNMERGWGMPSTYLECMQWFLAPTDSDNNNPDPKKAPHVISNSWSCPTEEGCTATHFQLMDTAIKNLRAAGIVFVASAGNNNPQNSVLCSSVYEPPAILSSAFSVGATNQTDGIAYFSSRGPVVIDGSNRMKPDISAPGWQIRSSYPPNTYSISSGTSMASPHVAGLIALMISANPKLAGQVKLIEDILRQTATPLKTTEGCGGLDAEAVPNNTFGYGRIDALAAVQKALTTTVDAEDASDNAPIAKAFQIGNVFPNPFNRIAQVEFHVTQPQFVSVKLFDLLGREQRTLFEGNMQANQAQSVLIEAKGLANGLYIVHIQGKNFSNAQKVTVIY
jgi:subtilisin family serine protease